jgi:hypothetical protein
VRMWLSWWAHVGLRIRGVLCRTPQEAKPEYARQGGHIRDRNRHLRE